MGVGAGIFPYVHVSSLSLITEYRFDCMAYSDTFNDVGVNHNEICGDCVLKFFLLELN